jgi:hypothetical protein
MLFKISNIATLFFVFLVHPVFDLRPSLLCRREESQMEKVAAPG